MKKFILLSVCYCAFSLAAQGPRPEVGIPENVRRQFETTCENITYNGQTLSARCRDNNQNLVSTSIDVNINPNSVIHNCNGNFCPSRCEGFQNSCPQRESANFQNPLANLQQQLANLQQQLDNTPKENFIARIRLHLEILVIKQQIDPNAIRSNLTTTLNTIKALIPTPVPANLEQFSNEVNNLLQQISPSTMQQSPHP
jgi:hypothetical protein